MTPFAWRSFLDLAERLLEEDADETISRTVVNRAYYAAFNIARDIVEHSERVPNLRAHYHVWRWLSRPERGQSVARSGQMGHRLSSLRNKADYEVDAAITVKDARQALRDARHLIDTLSARRADLR